ncbi:MAG: hypothetical protein WD431_23890, partial [Cyclobacteriaceae bacterium]
MRTNYTNTIRKHDTCFYPGKIRQKIIPIFRGFFGCCLSLLFIAQVNAGGFALPESRIVGNNYVTANNSGMDLPSLKAVEDLVRTLVDITVTGTVKDDNGDPLPGASVTVAGTT